MFLGDTGDEPLAGSAPAPSMTPAAFVILGPRQAAAGAPQGNNPRPKVKTKQIITTVAIDGLLDPLNPGGLVIPSTDGNGARRQKITVNVTNTPADWFADRNFGRDSVQVLRSSSKVDIYTSATGGQPLVYSGPGATNSFPANQPFPITLWVAGASSSNPSQTMKDVSITAQAYNQNKVGGLPGTALFTVLWVDDIQIKLNPSDGKTFSPENTAFATFNGVYHTSTIGGPQQIGGGSTPMTYFSWVYESRGNVHPANFSYPLNKTIDPNQIHSDVGYNHLHIARDIQAYYFFQNSNPQSDITEEWNSISPNANDTDTPKLQSDETSATGNIYAIDGPGLVIGPNTDPSWSNNEIRRQRFNAREFAEILAQGQPTRCSRISGFYVDSSIKQTKDNLGLTIWIPDNTYTNDNLSCVSRVLP